MPALAWVFALAMLMPARSAMAETVPVTQAGYSLALDDAFGRVAASGNYAYVADGVNGLKIIDISNPAAPVLTGACATGGRAYGIAVNGDYAYVANGDGGSIGLHIFDVSNPAAPTRTAYCGFSTNGQNVVLSGNYAYVAGSDLDILNISNPAVPVPAGHYNSSFTLKDVALKGNTAYCVGWHYLSVIDLSNISAPKLITSLEFPDSCSFNGIAISGNYAYLADGNLDPMVRSGSLRIVDISNPALPAAVGYTFAPAPTEDVAMVGNYAFMAAWMSGLAVYDISNPAAIFLAGSHDTPGYAYGVAVSGDYAYIADVNGLGIYHFVLPATPTPTATPTCTCTPTPAGGVPGNTFPVLVYPQPAQDQVNFRLGVGHDTEAKIIILNTAGDAVARITGRVSPSQPVLAWSAGQAGQGVYFYLAYLDGKLEAKGKLYIGR